MLNSDYLYQRIEIDKQNKDNNKQKIAEFKERLKAFEQVSELNEALILAEKIMPLSNEVNRFKVGDASCVVIKRSNLLRISLDAPDEYISFDFA